jgi:hypothetical protein
MAFFFPEIAHARDTNMTRRNPHDFACFGAEDEHSEYDLNGRLALAESARQHRWAMVRFPDVSAASARRPEHDQREAFHGNLGKHESVPQLRRPRAHGQWPKLSTTLEDHAAHNTIQRAKRGGIFAHAHDAKKKLHEPSAIEDQITPFLMPCFFLCVHAKEG